MSHTPRVGLYRSTITIWSEVNPAAMELSTLAREAETGSAYCAEHRSEFVAVPMKDAGFPEGAGEFFGFQDFGVCDHCDTVFEAGSQTDHCGECGNCFTHCSCIERNTG